MTNMEILEIKRRKTFVLTQFVVITFPHFLFSLGFRSSVGGGLEWTRTRTRANGKTLKEIIRAKVVVGREVVVEITLQLTPIKTTNTGKPP